MKNKQTSKIAIFTLLAFGALSGCREMTSFREHPKSSTFKKLSTEEFLDETIRQIPFDCGASSCPEFIGKVLSFHPSFSSKNDSVEPHSFNTCLGVLVSNELVVTSAKCIDPKIQSAQVSCSDQVAVRFLDLKGRKRVSKCKELVQFSEPQFKDVIGIRIEPSEIQPVPFSKSGIKDSEMLRVIYARTMSNGSQKSTLIESRSCLSRLGTILSPNGSNSPLSPSFAIPNCETFETNGILLNQMGEFLGISDQSTDRLPDFDWSALNIKIESHIKNQPKQWLIASHLTCLQIEPYFSYSSTTATTSQDQSLIRDCSSTFSLNLRSCVDLESPETYQNKINLSLENWSRSFVGRLRFQAHFLNESSIALAIPQCVTLDGNTGSGKTPKEIDLQFPMVTQIKEELHVDESLKPSMQILYKEDIHSRQWAKIKLKKEGLNWMGELQFSKDIPKEITDTQVSIGDCYVGAKSGLSKLNFQEPNAIVQSREILTPSEGRPICF